MVGRPLAKCQHEVRPRLRDHDFLAVEFDLDVHRYGAENHHMSASVPAIPAQAQIALLRLLRGSFDIGFLDCQPQANYKAGTRQSNPTRAEMGGATVQKGRRPKPTPFCYYTATPKPATPVMGYLCRLGCEELAPPARCDGIFDDLA